MKIVQVEPLGIDFKTLDAAKAEFEKLGHTYSYYPDRTENEDELISRIGNADILNISNIKLSSTVIEACKNLKYINVAFTGVDHIDLECCKKHNIAVSNAAGYSTEAVSELAVGLAVALLRNFIGMDKATRTLTTRNNYLGIELNGKTVGIIGTGAIGIATAKLFMAFGCKILAFSRSKKEINGIEYSDIETVFKNSDIISLHIPSNSETKGMINKHLLSLMKQSAVIINTARGQIIDNEALADHLVNNKIAGAAIDVYEGEPPLNANNPILKTTNTILLPHVGYASKEAMVKRFAIVLSNLRAYINGKQENIVL